MHFTAIQIRFLQDLHALEPVDKATSQVAEYFFDNYRLGRRARSGFTYTALDHASARNLLSTNNLPIVQGVLGTRFESAKSDNSEKMFSVAPHDDSIAIKVIGNCMLDGRPLWTPPGTYLVVRFADGLRIQCDAVMVVENFEPFRRLEEFAFMPVTENALVVYRGDGLWTGDHASRLVSQRKEPKWAFFDFDPAGLAMALALENLQRLVLPPIDWLVANGKTSRGRQLFNDQLWQREKSLDNTTDPLVGKAWRAMSAMCGAVTQEKMHAYRPEAVLGAPS